MREEDLVTIDVAVEKRFLTRRQADLIREELNTYPDEKAGYLMLRRHYVTDEQLDELWRAAREAVDKLATARETKQLAENEEQRVQEAAAQGEASGPHARIAQQTVSSVQAAGSPASEAQVKPAAPALAASGSPTKLPKGLVGFLRLARHWGCSDLHLSVGRPPFVRLHGQIRYMESEPLTPERSEELNFLGLTEPQRLLAVHNQQLDFALEIEGVGRHRCNVFKQRLGWDGVYRIVKADIPTVEQLGLPHSVRVFTEYHQGLVMVTGPGGSGKTTTVAALLNLVNEQRRDHIITVEDPVEYVIPAKNCQVTQREVGRHTQSFGNALRAALREDPDIILVGELRDHETTSIAISAAETGHLVFSTLHTSSAARTVARIVDVYPPSQQSQVCTMVAESLRGVISQQLVPRKDGSGPVLAYEILVNSTGISQQIKEKKTHLITSMMQGGKRQGMILMDECLLNLHRQEIISGREAYRRGANKPAFEAIKEED